jgi:hypothetical protein
VCSVKGGVLALPLSLDLCLHIGGHSHFWIYLIGGWEERGKKDLDGPGSCSHDAETGAERRVGGVGLSAPMARAKPGSDSLFSLSKYS